MISPMIVYNFAFRKNIFSRDVYGTFFILKRQCASRYPRSASIEKHGEQPVIVVHEYDNVDIIGPPDTVSNLRPIIRRNLSNETPLQKKLREMQNTTQEWNQHFWSDHNTKFIKERQKYIDLRLKKGSENQLTAEEMSEFYKKFLDENWQTHVKYNFEWYKKNFTLLLFALQVTIENLTRKVL
ncbi:apoptogenic protein 1, mitochondrial [Anoplophora glabripennis]|uniref:apoptogenic protein 1, mitochondrial n=1 Tax=Anoplophora glabripennis TaxID=217634 RepID=UPI000873733A|nr:apoptogenic protein 1, mitochondrial [Anoplophora glabripennis]